MKNTLMKYNKEEVNFATKDLGEVNVSDYFSREVHLSDITSQIENYSTYTATYRVQNDDKIERISYELYGTTDYWDILMMINSRDPLFGMPYNFDSISDNSTSFVDNYIQNNYNPAPLPSVTRINELKEEFLNKFDLDNEGKRYITVIKPSKMPDFIRQLRILGYL